MLVLLVYIIERASEIGINILDRVKRLVEDDAITDMWEGVTVKRTANVGLRATRNYETQGKVKYISNRRNRLQNETLIGIAFAFVETINNHQERQSL
jgi:hypothetical protein